MMEKFKNIDELLEKYFDGFTTIEEERVLKNYFSSDMIEESHKIYLPQFQIFECIKETKAPAILLDNKQQKIVAPQWVKYIAGIATACLLAIGIGYLFQPKKSDTYAIIHGKRVNNKEVAYAQADAQIQRSLKILENSVGGNINHPEIQDQIQKIKKEITLNN